MIVKKKNVRLLLRTYPFLREKRLIADETRHQFSLSAGLKVWPTELVVRYLTRERMEFRPTKRVWSFQQGKARRITQDVIYLVTCDGPDQFNWHATDPVVEQQSKKEDEPWETENPGEGCELREVLEDFSFGERLSFVVTITYETTYILRSFRTQGWDENSSDMRRVYCIERLQQQQEPVYCPQFLSDLR
jgi:hypothetical protein